MGGFTGYDPLGVQGSTDYLNQIPAADVGGGASGLGSLLGQGGGGIPGLGSILNLGQGIGNLMQGGVGNDISGAADIASVAALAIPGIGEILSPLLAMGGNLIGSLIPTGLPASTKPMNFANYMEQQGGLAGDLGKLIANAQNAAGGSSGVLSQTGQGAFNPNFMANLLETLTGQNLGSPNAQGIQTFASPPAGGAQQGVTMNFKDAAQVLGSLSMNQGAGYTPQQLSSPQALKAIEQATKNGFIGYGLGGGNTNVAKYLPQVEAALAKAGITPGAPTGNPPGGGGGGTTGGGGGAGGGGGGTGGGTGGGATGGLNLTGLAGLLGGMGAGGQTLGNLIGNALLNPSSGGLGSTGLGGTGQTTDYGTLQQYINQLQNQPDVSNLQNLLQQLGVKNPFSTNPNLSNEIGNQPLNNQLLQNLLGQQGGGGTSTSTSTGANAVATATANPTINNIIQQAAQQPAKQAPYMRFAMNLTPLSSAAPWGQYATTMPVSAR